ncbi:MAG: glutaminyl-peptide cyclotransferase [Erythrobacter sp.]|nr:glutaminyl-peptide cyclotransferase [Erythrobacter sp.]NCQ62593.1 glutaminyl-peptide cyclotransferase [Alphaproteobacteria bacterium]
MLATPALALAQQPAADESRAPAAATAADAQPQIFDVQVVARYPHDAAAFTQGLLWHDGFLYETTGRRGQSQLRKVDLQTGEVLSASDLAADEFGEGLALWGDELIGLTWLDGTIHRWSLDTLEPIRSDPYPYEGWGLATIGDALVASDGSATLRFLDPETYAVRREVAVTLNGKPLTQLNELEAVDGLIYANIWHSGFIVAIDPADGVVRRILDLRPLVDAMPLREREGVLNGIAHDPATGRWFVTGKLWPSLFEVRFVPRGDTPPDS